MECYFDRVFRSANTSKKRKLELESSFSDERAKLKFFRRGSNLSGIRFGKNEFAIGCSLSFPFLLHPLLRKKEKKKRKCFFPHCSSLPAIGNESLETVARKKGEPLCTGQFPLSFVSRWKKDGPLSLPFSLFIPRWWIRGRKRARRERETCSHTLYLQIHVAGKHTHPGGGRGAGT